jgi:hypothetical protein
VKLPGVSFDVAAMCYDPLRDRLVFARKHAHDAPPPYDGQLYALDFSTMTVTRLSPRGGRGAGQIPFVAYFRHDPKHDLMLVGATLPPGADGFRRTAAYDPAGNRWVSLKIGGDDPHNQRLAATPGWHNSLGFVYDEKRELFWTVDERSRVFALRLDPATADVQPLAD